MSFLVKQPLAYTQSTVTKNTQWAIGLHAYQHPYLSYGFHVLHDLERSRPDVVFVNGIAGSSSIAIITTQKPA